MTVKLFYKTSSAGSDEGLSDIQKDLTEYGAECQMIDVESVEGSAEQELYGVMTYPTVVVTGNDGSIIRRWSGVLPAAADIRYALGSV